MFLLITIYFDRCSTDFQNGLQSLRRGQKLDRRIVSLKGRAVVLGRNPPVTKKMEKSHRQR